MTSLPDPAVAERSPPEPSRKNERNMPGSGRAAWLALATITVIGIALRVRYVRLPMRWDETYAFLNYSFKPIGDGLATYTPNNHLLHTLLAGLASRAFGMHPEVIRLPALLAGSMLAPAVFLTARRLWNGSVALLAAVFVSASSLLVEFSVNARGYTMLALATLAAVFLGDRLLERRTIGRCLAFGAAGAVGLATIPLAILPFFGVAIWLLVSTVSLPTDDRRATVGWIALGTATAVAGGALVYLPAVARHGIDPILRNEWISPRTWAGFTSAFPESASATWSRWTTDIPLFVSIALGVGFLLSTVLHRRISKGPIPVPLVMIAWSLAFVAARRVVPYPRNWIFALPIFLASASAGIAWLADRLAGSKRWTRAAPLVAVGLCALLAVQVLRADSIPESADTGRFRAAPPIAAALAQTVSTHDRILATKAAHEILEFYLRARDVSPALLNGRLDVRGNIFIVVDTGAGGSLEDMIALLDRGGVDVSRRPSPVLVGRYPDGELYRVGPPGAG